MRAAVSAVCIALIFSFQAAAAEPMLQQDFEQSPSGWTPFGPESAHISITHDPALVKVGKGALAFEYEASAESPAAALLPLTKSIGGARSIQFWLMAESATAAAVVLNERHGGRYIAIVWLEPRTWQRVELTPEDFILGQSATDPKDPDGKLDLDQVQAVAILDISQIFNPALAEGKAPLAIVPHSGPQKLWLDSFEISADVPAWYHSRAPYSIDDFAHPQADWMTFGGADLKISGHMLEASYEQLEDRFAMMVHALPPMDLTGAGYLAFEIASDKPAHLIISLQEQSPGKNEGPRYNAEMELPGDGKFTRRQLAFSSFELSDDSPDDPDGKLDLNQLRSIGILDVYGAYTQSTGVNTIRIRNIEAVKSPAPAK